MKKLTCALAAAITFSIPAFAADSPEAYVQESFTTLQEGNYEEAADYYSEDALADFRGMMGFINELPDEASAGFYNYFFGEEASAESVEELTDAQFFANFLEGMFTGGPTGEVDLANFEVLGSVDKEDMHYVVTRNKVNAGEMEIESLEVVPVKETDGDYKLTLTGRMKGAAAQMKQLVQQQQQQMRMMQQMQQQQQQQQGAPGGQPAPQAPQAPQGQ